MCTEFIVCPAFGDRILGEFSKPLVHRLVKPANCCSLRIEVCASNSALKRQTAALYSVVALDIASDILRNTPSKKSIDCNLLIENSDNDPCPHAVESGNQYSP